MNNPPIQKSFQCGLYATSLLLLAVCLAGGFLMAQNKPLWNDEMFTLIANVNGQTYGSILLGKVSEGNVAPLFYWIQKAICDLAHYSVPSQWIKGEWGFRDPYSEILLRIQPVFWMSLSVASGTRMNGTAGVPRQLQIIFATSEYVRGLCCISIQRKSNPALAIAQ